MQPLTDYRDKIIGVRNLSMLRECFRAANQDAVLCHGCFDLFHYGHLRHLEAARSFGDVLVAVVTPDRYVGKGPGRPIFPETERLELVASLEVVDYAALTQWRTAVPAIELLQPAIFAKGSDYQTRTEGVNPNIYAEEHALAAIGGRLEYTDEATYSSTHLLSGRALNESST